jgi:hypothetical protein
MGKRRDRDRDDVTVSAKDLAEMGFCEKRVLLTHLHGQRLTPAQRHRAERGRQAHQLYYREGIAARAAPESDRRCFVATCLFGDSAWQTDSLRLYRDDVLLPSSCGRFLVSIYYRLAPGACALVQRWPCVLGLMRAMVGALAAMAQRRSAKRGDS